MNGPDVSAANSFAQPRQVDVREISVTGRRDGFDYVCPAHSITVLRLTAR